MMSHPPIPINELAEHTELLKANDNLRLSQEYEVKIQQKTKTHLIKTDEKLTSSLLFGEGDKMESIPSGGKFK